MAFAAGSAAALLDAVHRAGPRGSNGSFGAVDAAPSASGALNGSELRVYGPERQKVWEQTTGGQSVGGQRDLHHLSDHLSDIDPPNVSSSAPRARAGHRFSHRLFFCGP